MISREHLAVFGLVALASLPRIARAQIFIADENVGVGEYTTAGVTVSRGRVPIPSGIGFPTAVATDGAGHLFVLSSGGVIGEYTTAGEAIAPYLVTGLGFNNYGLAYDGDGHLFVTLFHGNAVAEYSVTGEAINAGLILGINEPTGIASDGNGHLFVASWGNGTVQEYLPTGDFGNFEITGLNDAWAVALDGKGGVFVANNGSGSVGAYTTNGTTINASLITGLSAAYGLAADGQGHLFVVNWGLGEIAEYTTEGFLVNPALVTGLSNPLNLALQLPEALPVSSCGGPYVTPCGKDMAALQLDGSASSDPYGGPLTFHWSSDCSGVSFDDSSNPTPKVMFVPSTVAGGCTISLTVSNPFGLGGTCSTHLSVQDTTPPEIDGAGSVPAILWPPDHKMVNVQLDYTLSDQCDPSSDLKCELNVSSEPPVAGNGKHSPDWEVVDAHHVRLRAARAGRGGGRVYQIRVTCTDLAGNSVSKTLDVTVPGHEGPARRPDVGYPRTLRGQYVP